jgi:hypothetical protein
MSNDSANAKTADSSRHGKSRHGYIHEHNIMGAGTELQITF